MSDYIAFYGSLMERAKDATAPSRVGLSTFVEPCRLAGVIRDHGRYPGFFAEERGEGASIVEGELHRLIVPHALTVFDRWEDYDPNDEPNSPYIRRKIRLIDPAIDAWVYISKLSNEDPIVQGGDWATYRRRNFS